MATPSEAVQGQLAVITAATADDLMLAASLVPVEQQAAAMLASTNTVVSSYYFAAGALAVAWYGEIRDESNPLSAFVPDVIGGPATDWIEREATKFRESLTDVDLAEQMAKMAGEITGLAQKEVARGFRDSITGNTARDPDALGWSRVARLGACKFCLMLADKGAIFRNRSSATFAAHTNCNCAARPTFRNGEQGPEASAIQYLASKKRRSEKDKARLRRYLAENYPDAPG